MARTRLHLRLHPRTADGTSTWLSLSGPLPTQSGSRVLCRLIGALATCTAEPLRVVLSAGDRAAWCKTWRAELARVHERHRTIHLRARRQDRAARGDDQLDLFRGTR